MEYEQYLHLRSVIASLKLLVSIPYTVQIMYGLIHSYYFTRIKHHAYISLECLTLMITRVVVAFRFTSSSNQLVPVQITGDPAAG